MNIKVKMSSIDSNVHPQVRIFVTMLCEGFNVPISETKIMAFSDKLKHPHTQALRETYNMFTDGRASQTNKMPTIAEVMEVYKTVEKRITRTAEQKLLENIPKEVDYAKSKEMFAQLTETVKKGVTVKHHGITDMPVEGYQNGYKFTLSRDEKGQDWVNFHNHPATQE